MRSDNKTEVRCPEGKCLKCEKRIIKWVSVNEVERYIREKYGEEFTKGFGAMLLGTMIRDALEEKGYRIYGSPEMLVLNKPCKPGDKVTTSLLGPIFLSYGTTPFIKIYKYERTTYRVIEVLNDTNSEDTSTKLVRAVPITTEVYILWCKVKKAKMKATLEARRYGNKIHYYLTCLNPSDWYGRPGLELGKKYKFRIIEVCAIPKENSPEFIAEVKSRNVWRRTIYYVKVPEDVAEAINFAKGARDYFKRNERGTYQLSATVEVEEL